MRNRFPFKPGGGTWQAQRPKNNTEGGNVAQGLKKQSERSERSPSSQWPDLDAAGRADQDTETVRLNRTKDSQQQR